MFELQGEVKMFWKKFWKRKNLPLEPRPNYVKPREIEPGPYSYEYVYNQEINGKQCNVKFTLTVDIDKKLFYVSEGHCPRIGRIYSAARNI